MHGFDNGAATRVKRDNWGQLLRLFKKVKANHGTATYVPVIDSTYVPPLDTYKPPTTCKLPWGPVAPVVQLVTSKPSDTLGSEFESRY